LYLKKECERLIYEVRLRDIPIRGNKVLDNFITYVIATDDGNALVLANDIVVELEGSLRSVVAKPRMSLEMLHKTLDMVSSKPRGKDEIQSILKFSKQAFKGFKGYKE